jgi:NAD-dependent dihydropyrimidine dehydrogenase PreA subunit
MKRSPLDPAQHFHISTFPRRPEDLKEAPMQVAPFAFLPHNVPVSVDADKCIADKGCTVCVDVCPLDVLAIDISKGTAYMKFDECWYCMPCEKDCPTGAVRVDIPYLLR